MPEALSKICALVLLNYMGLHKVEVTERKLANIFLFYRASWMTNESSLGWLSCVAHCMFVSHVLMFMRLSLVGTCLRRFSVAAGFLREHIITLELRTFYVIAISSCILSNISFPSHLLYLSAAAHSTVAALLPKPRTSSDGLLPTCGNAFTIANCFAGRTVSFGWMKRKHIIWRMCSRNLLLKLADFCAWAQFLGCV